MQTKYIFVIIVFQDLQKKGGGWGAGEQDDCV
jgi:hypothetical protein